MRDEMLSEIAFDLYERYSPIPGIASLFATEGKPPLVLDVGGYTPALRRGFPSMIAAVLPEARTVVAGIEPGPGLASYVQASALSLPFADGTFDLVTCCDLLEHIPAGRHIRCLRELLRVTRSSIYLTFPHDSEANCGHIHSFLESTGIPAAVFLRAMNRRFSAQSIDTWSESHYRTCLLASKTHSAAELDRWVSIAGSSAKDRPGNEARLERLERQIETLREEIAKSRKTGGAERDRADLQRYAARDMERQLIDLRLRVDENTRQISLILQSRVWRTLCTAGAYVLTASSLLVRATRRLRPERASDIELVCEDPPAGDSTPRSGVITVRGWALAPPGVDRVEVRIDSGPSQQAEYGLPRPDVAIIRPNAKDASKCGFKLKLEPHLVPRGRHRICLRAVSRSGHAREIETAIVIGRAFASDYERWIADWEDRDEEAIQVAIEAFTVRPLVSIVTPVYRTAPDILERAVESVRRQSYTHWELCLADDCSESPELDVLLTRLCREDPRIKVVQLRAQSGISAASNAALDLASGDFIGLLDHDDELAVDALFHMVDAVNRAPDADLLYSDEDKIDLSGRRYDPFFKPDWSPDLLLSENYICHFAVARRELIERAGRFRPEFDGSQDHDLLLRIMRLTDRIVHVPRVLYHWRAIETSTAQSVARKPQSVDAASRAIEDYLLDAGIPARVEPGRYPGRWRVRYPIPEESRVSIIIPSGGKLEVLRRNLDCLTKKTEYREYEVLVVDNSNGDRIGRFIRGWKKAGRGIEYLDCRGQPFNWSALNNQAVARCDSPLLLFLNDDTEVIVEDWLTALVELSARPEVGAVGAKLLYPDGRIQHAGVVMGVFDNCGHAFRGLPGNAQHYFDFPDVIRNVSAVTGACLMVRRQVFEELGGFDERRFPVAFNDIDFCLRAGARGYRNVYTPHALLYHHEAFSKTSENVVPDSAEVLAMRSSWGGVIDADPYYNPNLTRRAEDYGYA